MNQYPALPSPTNSVQTKWGDASRIENSNLLAPPMPEGVVAVAQDWKSASKSKTLLGRTKSTKVRILGSTEDLTAVTGNPVERQVSCCLQVENYGSIYFYVVRPTFTGDGRIGRKYSFFRIFNSVIVFYVCELVGLDL